MSNIFKKIKFCAKNIRQKKHIKLYDKSVILWKLYMEKFQLKKMPNFVKLFSCPEKHMCIC